MKRGLTINLVNGKSYHKENEQVVTRIEVESELYNNNLKYQEKQ